MIGIDLSHHQGMVDFHSLVSDNTPKIDFGFIKATQGIGYVDSMLKFNAIHANNYGLPISYYHFATLNTENVIVDAQAEAEFFVKTIKNLPKPSFPVALDIETNKAGLDKTEVLTWINSFFARIYQLGYQKYFLYSYTFFLDSNLPHTHNLGSIPLWIAAYTKKLKLPVGWAKETIWQYSAKGQLKGIHTDVDMNKSPEDLF